MALQILELTRNEHASVEDLQRVLVTDPALSGQILKFANSALARGNSEARTVGEAVVRLGMANVRQLALGFSLLSAARCGPCEGFDYNRFWSRSLASGVAAQCLAPLVPRTAPDEAFTCGLLGSIGTLCLASVHPRDFASILARWDGAEDSGLRQLELEVLLTDHNQVTAALMENWGLPDRYSVAIVAQADLGRGGEVPSGLTSVLAVARDIAEMCLAPDARRPELAESLLARGESLGLASANVIAASDQALEEWSRLGEVLDILTEDVPSLAELARNGPAASRRATGLPPMARRTRTGMRTPSSWIPKTSPCACWWWMTRRWTARSSRPTSPAKATGSNWPRTAARA